jgi:hypothetical protein
LLGRKFKDEKNDRRYEMEGQTDKFTYVYYVHDGERMPGRWWGLAYLGF